MATQEKLHEAYAAFRIPVGSSWEVIKKRYKVLVRVWHPDRQGESMQSDAERELKEINHFYQDVFKPHFEGGEHQDNRYCICQTVPSSQTKSESSKQEEKASTPPPPPPPKPEPEFESKFVWEPNFESEFKSAVKTKPASKFTQKDAAVACLVVFLGLSLFSAFVNITKKSFAKSTDHIAYVAPQASTAPLPQPVLPPPVRQISDDSKRAIVFNETKMDSIAREIATLQVQIKFAAKESSGQLNRELGVKEEELRQLQMRTYELKHGN
ncbi:MAG: J domain-containing protein [Candidatus Melainabacteria bacterium]|nr:J domain-containing protein [Candidatus Melainabacteria bacterium]